MEVFKAVYKLMEIKWSLSSYGFNVSVSIKDLIISSIVLSIIGTFIYEIVWRD